MPMNGEQSDRRCWFCPFFMSTTDGDMTASCWSCPWCIVIIINLSWLLQSEYSSIYSYSAGWDCSWQACGPVGDSIDVALVAIISTMIGDAMFIHSFASKKSLAMRMHLGLLAFLRPLSQSGSWAHRMCSAISHSLTFFYFCTCFGCMDISSDQIKHCWQKSLFYSFFLLKDKTKMRPLIIKSIITATFYVSSTAVQIADPTILLIPFANAMRLSATIVFLFSSATGSTTNKNVCE